MIELWIACGISVAVPAIVGVLIRAGIELYFRVRRRIKYRRFLAKYDRYL